MICEWCQIPCDVTESRCDCEERLACDKAGDDGHRACGWCRIHGGPMWECLDSKSCAHWLLARLYEVESAGTAVRWCAVTLVPRTHSDSAASVRGATPRDVWRTLQRASRNPLRAYDQITRMALRYNRHL